MRIQKIEFWHEGKSLILENRSQAKVKIDVEISTMPRAAHEGLKSFVVHKRTRAAAILVKAKELAVAFCGKEEEVVVRDIYDVICRMSACI